MTPPDMTPPVPSLDEMAELVSSLPSADWRAFGCCVVDKQRDVAIADEDDGRHVAKFIAAARAFVPWAIARIRELIRYNDSIVYERNAANQRTFQAAHERDVALARIRELETELAALKGGAQ